MRPKHDRAWLLSTARTVAKELKERAFGTGMRIRIPTRATETITDGWLCVIGDLGKGQPRLEIWLDRFSGYPERKLWACLRAKSARQMLRITKEASARLCPVRTVTIESTVDEKHLVLERRLARSEFNAPVLEKYGGDQTFFGIYDPTRKTAERINLHFCARAAAFFEDVARLFPHATTSHEDLDVFPRHENRKRVASHILRERSRLLSAECKIRDGYKCQVCGLDFERIYGDLGKGFAEAHHKVPLSKLRENVRTQLRDLVTVCANCHRMLHRMSGQAADVANLKRLVRSRKRRRS